MADTQSIILRKIDPFVLDESINNLETLSPNSSSSSYGCLPLESDPGGSGKGDRPFLKTPFNKVDAKNYRKPGDASGASSSSSEKEILDLEQTADEVWNAYRELYYGHDAVGSVFVRRKGADPRTAGTPSKMKKSGGALEALFAIQKKCKGEEGGEIARWDSVHTVTIEVPNFENGTCEYKIKSAVWCRYKPEDVGDVPRAERIKPSAPLPVKKKAPCTKPSAPKKGKTGGSKLDIKRLEVFDRAANQWDSKKNLGDKKEEPEPPKEVVKKVLNSPPVPAVVTSSAVYTKDTTKVCKLLSSGKKKQSEVGIPVASHIQNIGSLLEKIETDFRSKFERVDAPKCVEVVQGMYRPSLSPGLKLSSGDGSMISKLGGHATGMGVGKGLIGEIALKAKAKGLGDSSSTNKAMEGILANEKKKLEDIAETKSSTPDTWVKKDLKKSNSFGAIKKKPSQRTPGFKRPNLRKAVSVRTFDGPSTTSATPEFMNFRSKLKPTAAK